MTHPAYKLNLFQIMGVKASAEEGLQSLLRANEGESMNSVRHMHIQFEYICTLHSAGTYNLQSACSYYSTVSPKPQCCIWLLIGKCYLTQGKITEAKTWFQQVVDFEHPTGVLNENVRE